MRCSVLKEHNALTYPPVVQRTKTTHKLGKRDDGEGEKEGRGRKQDKIQTVGIRGIGEL